MKKLGFEVEQVDMPEYKDLLGGEIDLDPELVNDQYQEILFRRNQLIVDDGDQGYKLLSFPDGVPARWGSNKVSDGELLNTGELLKEYTEDEFVDFTFDLVEKSMVPKEMDTTFNVIRLTDEVKEQFKKSGMNMYSSAPVVGVAAAEAEKQKRSEDGRFSK